VPPAATDWVTFPAHWNAWKGAWRSTHARSALDTTLAQVYEALARLEDAKEQYETIMRLRPGDAEAYHDLSEIYYYEKNEDKAIAVLQMAVEQCPNNTRLLYTLSYLFASRDVEVACRLLKQAIKVNHRFAMGYLTLAGKLFEFGRLEVMPGLYRPVRKKL
jgi:tetratricopeptide (TPR) repeat protein